MLKSKRAIAMEAIQGMPSDCWVAAEHVMKFTRFGSGRNQRTLTAKEMGGFLGEAWKLGIVDRMTKAIARQKRRVWRKKS